MNKTIQPCIDLESWPIVANGAYHQSQVLKDMHTPSNRSYHTETLQTLYKAE